MLLTAFANTVSLVNLNISTEFNLKLKFIAPDHLGNFL